MGIVEVAVGSLIVSSIFAGASYMEQKEAHKDQVRAAEAQQRGIDARNRMAAAEQARKRRNEMRQARIARAQVTADVAAGGGSVAAGTQGSSMQGAQASVTQQLGANLSFLDSQQGLAEYAAAQSKEAFKHRVAAEGHMTTASGYSAASRVFSSASNLASKYG